MDLWAWLRRHVLDVVAASLGAAALARGVLSLFPMGNNVVSGWLIASAVMLSVAAFACLAASGFLEASR